MNISVILTSYNHERFLRESIESVLLQSYSDFEFIIVDDCSTDASWEIICEYKKKHPEIITIRHSYNWGNGIVEDTVRNYATGDYIALHHSDDIWEKNKLLKQIEAMKSVPGCAAVFTNATAIYDDGTEYLDKNGFYYQLFSVENRSRQEWLNYFFYNGNCLCHPSVLIRKDAYMEDGFFRKGLRQIPDYVKWIQVCKRYEIYVLPEALVRFRIHHEGKNTSGMRADTQIRSTVELFMMLSEYQKIKERDEFLRVFPKAEKYCTEDFFCAEYALGRICTEDGMPSYTRLFGVRLLYGVLNQSELAGQIEAKFGYTKQDFVLENGKHDIFGILPKAFEQTRTIYYDTGSGYRPEESITEAFTLDDMALFEMTCTIRLREGQKISRIRFDPAERVMVGCRILNVTVNGVKTECVGENALCHKVEMDLFVNLDPIYSIDLPEGMDGQNALTIKIEGQLFRLTDDEISCHVTGFLYASRELQADRQAILDELNNIKSTKTYRVLKKIRSKIR